MSKISMYAASAPVFVRMLNNLDAVLAKGEADATARNYDPQVLFDARLAPTMLPLRAQIGIASDMAKNGVFRLAGQTPPVFEDNEKTYADLHARVARTIDAIKSVPESAFEGAETRDITLKFGSRPPLEFKGLDYLLGFVLPNFYFHVTTAYAILRHNGVNLSKSDFMGG
jgi:uncharacterized protein